MKRKKTRCYNCLVRKKTSKILGLCDRCISFAANWIKFVEKTRHARS